MTQHRVTSSRIPVSELNGKLLRWYSHEIQGRDVRLEVRDLHDDGTCVVLGWAFRRPDPKKQERAYLGESFDQATIDLIERAKLGPFSPMRGDKVDFVIFENSPGIRSLNARER